MTGGLQDDEETGSRRGNATCLQVAGKRREFTANSDLFSLLPLVRHPAPVTRHPASEIDAPSMRLP